MLTEHQAKSVGACSRNTVGVYNGVLPPGTGDRSSGEFNKHDAGWSSPVAREAHNLEVAGSNPVPAIRTPESRNPRSRGFLLRRRRDAL